MAEGYENMDSIVEFIRFLDGMSTPELQDYLEDYWRGEFELTPQEEWHLVERIRGLKAEPETEKDYIIVWLVLLALVAIDGELITPITSIFSKLPEPTQPVEFDLMWITEGDDLVCPMCAPLDGKIYGVDFTLKPKLHPECRCELKKVKKGVRAMKIGTLQAGAVRAISEGKKRILEVLAAPFGSPSQKDRLGQFLSANTNFMCDVGDRRPTLYLHGHSPRGRAMTQPVSIGIAEVTKIDKKGLWMRSELDDSELSDRTWKAALEGNARASTGSVNYLERHDDLTGEVMCWPIAELSVFDGGEDRIPVSDDAIVLPLRSLFEASKITLPEHFEAGKDKRDNRRAKRNLDKKEINMTTEVEKAVAEALAARDAEKEAEVALRAEIKAEIEKDLKEIPNYRATFNVNKIDDKEAKKDAVKEENFAYVRALIEQGKAARDGRPIPGMPSGINPDPAKRTLEETEAAELGSMVPEDLYNKIHAILGKYSLVDKMAAAGLLTIYKTDKLTFSVPTETTAMTPLADIAEEGAYVANEMAFVAKTATMQKVGNYLSVTEESLEDQDLFQQYLVKACAKAIALSKNLALHVLCDAVAGTAIASTDVIVDGELIALYYGLAQEYREGSCIIMNDDTLAYIRAMLIATPRAYGEFGFNPMSMGEMGESLMNKPIYTNANWVALVGGATNNIGVTHANFDEGIYWVERRKMGIFVDPYSTKLSAGTVNFLPSARYGGVTVNAAAFNGIELLS